MDEVPSGLTPAPDNDTGSLVFNTTYIIINRFANVGTAATADNPGVDTLWALDEAQFATLQNTFRITGNAETALEGTTVTATQSVTSGTRTFAIGLVTGNAPSSPAFFHRQWVR